MFLILKSTNYLCLKINFRLRKEGILQGGYKLPAREAHISTSAA